MWRGHEYFSELCIRFRFSKFKFRIPFRKAYVLRTESSMNLNIRNRIRLYITVLYVIAFKLLPQPTLFNDPATCAQGRSSVRFTRPTNAVTSASHQYYRTLQVLPLTDTVLRTYSSTHNYNPKPYVCKSTPCRVQVHGSSGSNVHAKYVHA